MHNKKLKIIISGGGTGGHIFPAIAIANAFNERYPNARILFVGAKGRMEMEKVPKAGYHIIALDIIGIQRKISLRNLMVPIKLYLSLIKAKRILKKFKPDAVIGVGGYASGPVLRKATKLGIPTVIQEQNSFPGLTNRILSKNVTKICVAYEGMGKYFPEEKIYLTGNPVRKDIENLEVTQEEALNFFNLQKRIPIILAIGGSLGSKTINNCICRLIDELGDRQIQIIWQTGKQFFQEANNLIKSKQIEGVQVNEFITRMDLAYKAADIIVSRAGAIAVSEISLVAKPAILIPLPSATEDHQTKNAMALVNHNAAVLLPDNIAADNISKEVFSLIDDEIKVEKIKRNIAGMGIPNSADKIVSVITSIIKTE